MHIVLLILKIIGILLAVIVGILIILLLTVLLVPIRYRINGQKQEDIHICAKAGWLLRILFIKGIYEKGEFRYWVKLFGFTLNTNMEKKVKQKKAEKEKKTVKEKPMRQPSGESPPKITKEPPPTKTEEPPKPQTNPPKKEPLSKPFKIPENQEKDTKRKSLFTKIKECIEKIKNTIRGIRNKIKNIIKNIKASAEKAKKLYHFICGEENKPGFHKTYESIKKIIKHIWPKKGKGELRVGTGDPYTMGQVLSIMSIFYGIYGPFITVTPDFEEALLEAKFYFKGRIRIGTLLIIALKLILSQEFKTVMKNYKQLKEEL